MSKTRVKSYRRKKPNGGYTTVKSHLRNISNKGTRHKRMQKKQTLFVDSRYQKYNDIVTFKSPEGASYSALLLMKEFNKAKTKDKKLRVARVAQYSANRARASSRRANLSSNERKELKDISKFYGKIAVKMWKEYRKL